MLEKMRHLDRRWVFLLMFLCVAASILFQIRFPEKPSPMVRNIFRTIDELPEGSKVLLALDYDPAGRGELQPMAAAFVRHCARKKHKMYFMTIWPQGPPMIKNCTDIIEQEFQDDYEYGKNYVNLGFRAGLEGVIKEIVTDLRMSYTNDQSGQSLDRFEMTRNLKNIQEMDLIVTVSAGDPGTKEWIQYAATPFGIKAVSGCTGVQAPIMLPYIPGQLVGVLAGIKGAAEYEQALLTAYPELRTEEAQEGLRRMGPQVVAHVLMILLIIAGNVIFYLERSQGAAG